MHEIADSLADLLDILYELSGRLDPEGNSLYYMVSGPPYIVAC